MTTFLVIVWVVTVLALLLVAGAQPLPAELSLQELKRRAKRSERAKQALLRAERMPDIVAVLRIKSAILLVLSVIFALLAFGWLFGILLSIVLALFYSPLAHVRPMARVSSRLYEKFEPNLIRTIGKLEPVFIFLRDTSLYPQSAAGIASKEELQELLENSTEVLTDDDRKLVVSALSFSGKQVADHMTPRKAIDSIKKDEFLGPLVLDELHALGHSRLPVIGGSIDNVVGILYLRDLLSLDQRHSATAEEIMEKKVYYIYRDDTLEHALAAFLKTHHHLFVVINDESETVGILSLEDTIEALVGKRIIDEDDVHGDRHTVASRKGKG